MVRVDPPDRARELAKILRGLSGMAASSITFVCSTPDFVEKMLVEFQKNDVSADEFINQHYELKNILTFCLGLLGDAITLGSGVYKIGKQPAVRLGEENDEFTFLGIIAVMWILLISYQTVEYEIGPEYREKVGHNMRTASKLLFARDLLEHIGKIPGFMFNG